MSSAPVRRAAGCWQLSVGRLGERRRPPSTASESLCPAVYHSCSVSGLTGP